MNGVKRKKIGFARNGRGGGSARRCCCRLLLLLRFCYGSATVLLLLPLLFDGTVGRWGCCGTLQDKAHL